MLKRHSLAVNCARHDLRHTSIPASGAGRPYHRHNRPPCQEPGGTQVDSMAAMRLATGMDLQAAAVGVLESSSSRLCRGHGASGVPTTGHSFRFCEEASVHSLVTRGFAWRTIHVHRSAISSILEPHKPVAMEQHSLVCQFMKEVFNLRPSTTRLTATWDVSHVLPLLADWHPAEDIALRVLSKEVSFLSAISSAKRVSHLSLFSVDSSLCFLGENTVVLQTCFGTETDLPSRYYLCPFVARITKSGKSGRPWR